MSRGDFALSNLAVSTFDVESSNRLINIEHPTNRVLAAFAGAWYRVLKRDI